MHAERVVEEARALAALQELEGAEEAIDALSHLFARYAEIVLSEDGLELITGGRGPDAAEALAALSAAHGASLASCEAFLVCARARDDRPLGLKIALGPDAARPSLYVRTMIDVDAGLALLARALPGVEGALPALREAHASTSTLYGVGFDGDGGAKTYVIAEAAPGVTGFVSYRIRGGSVQRDPKRYLPDVPWQAIPVPSERWRCLLELGRELGYERAGHVGFGPSGRMKVYVERIGAIPTDYRAR